MDTGIFSFLYEQLMTFISHTAFSNLTWGHIVMIAVGLFFINLAITKHYEPLLLIPIGFGIIIGNIPFDMEADLQIGLYEEGSVLNMLYFGVQRGLYPPIIFLGIGAMTDFSSLLSKPRLVLLGAAAQFGILPPMHSRSTWALNLRRQAPLPSLAEQTARRRSSSLQSWHPSLSDPLPLQLILIWPWYR